jgi:DNA-binding transcriptional LysR family regulator
MQLMGAAMEWNEQRLGRQLKLRDLHVLLTVAKYGSMGKAAIQLSVSQPAISKVISDMERALGVRLLDRKPQGVEPTIYARALLDRSALAFDELKQAIEQIRFLANPTTGELRIGSTIAIATGFMPAVIDRLSRQYPKMVFHLSAGEAAMTYRTLEERTVDLVVAPIFAEIDEQHLHAEFSTMSRSSSWPEVKAHGRGGARLGLPIWSKPHGLFRLSIASMDRWSPKPSGPADWISRAQRSSLQSRPRAMRCLPPAALSASFRVP